MHHYNKGVGYAPNASQGLRVRGSIDIIAAMDAVVTVTAGGTHSAPRRLVTPEKNREMPEEGAMSFSLSPGASLPTPDPSLKGAPAGIRSGGEKGALRLVFEAVKAPSTRGTDLIPAVLEVLRHILRPGKINLPQA